MTDLPRPRSDLAGFGAYRTQQQAADVRVQANEWAEPNPAARWLAVDELNDVLLNRYPSGQAAAALRAALASEYGVGPDQIILGNGSNELLLSTFLVFGGAGRTTLLFQPTYSMHARLTVIAGGTVADEVVGLPYDLSVDQALTAMERVRPEIVAITSPNNPTGNLVPAEVTLAIARAHPRTLVLQDEAYSDFAGTTLVGELERHPNIVISKTFSKARAAAGLRLGILIAHPELAELYRASQLPYSISAITLAVGLKMVHAAEETAARVEQCRVERERLAGRLATVPGITAFPSVTNFILLRVHEGDTAGVHARFLREGVLIRDISTWPGSAGCVRISVGTREENDRIIAAIDRVFDPAVA
ncbi:MAG: aminotransferase class I/II-fold pyridoxal phosphate-dependent enzyme [Chloroflexota bacterium]|nr:aminotransferase class I/II-fold pyridoxal phosphate-dependent enzyme [Chloroflexota bacterium]